MVMGGRSGLCPKRRLWKLGVWGAEALTDGTDGDCNGNSDSDDSLHTTRT